MLKDGNKITLKCSSCNKKLVNIWITRPDESYVWKIRAKCCYCDDHSFDLEVKGGFHFGGYCEVTNPNTEDETFYTCVTKHEVENDRIVLYTEKTN